MHSERRQLHIFQPGLGGIGSEASWEVTDLGTMRSVGLFFRGKAGQKKAGTVSLGCGEAWDRLGWSNWKSTTLQEGLSVIP